jgi:hypothetical protein
MVERRSGGTGARNTGVARFPFTDRELYGSSVMVVPRPA